MPVDKKDFPRGVTPAGVAVFPKLNEPDTKFEKAGVFSVKLQLEGADADALNEKYQQFYEEAYAIECADKGKKKLKRADASIKPAETKDGEEIPGAVWFNFKRKASGETRTGRKWQASIDLFDANLNRITDEIWGGTKLRVSYRLVPWFNGSLGFGVRLELSGVQVLDLVGPGGERSGESHGFGAEEGYTSTPPATVTSEDSGDEEEEEEEF